MSLLILGQNGIEIKKERASVHMLVVSTLGFWTSSVLHNFQMLLDSYWSALREKPTGL